MAKEHAPGSQLSGFQVIACTDDCWVLLRCPDTRCRMEIFVQSKSTLGKLIDLAKSHLAGQVSETHEEIWVEEEKR